MTEMLKESVDTAQVPGGVRFSGLVEDCEAVVF